MLSSRAQRVDASGIRKVFDLAAKLKDPINFSIGLPDFDVPEPAKLAAHQAIDAGHNRYTPTQGIAPLRERLRRDLSSEFGRDVGDVLITSGVSGGLQLVMQALVDPGDEVLYLDPNFVMYRHLLTLTDGVSVPVDSYPDFRFPADRVEAAITSRTKAIILNSPANPTGVLLTAADIAAAVDIARRHDLYIISDEIYEPFVFLDDARLTSPLAGYEKTIVLRGFSKSHAMTGWRVGYAFGHAPAVELMTRLQQYTFVCAPAPFQHAALAALDLDMRGHVAAYRRKRDLVVEMLAPKFEIVTRPEGAFYVFPKVPDGQTATEFCTRAIEKNVLVIPGNVFSARDTHFRISYATTDEKLVQGCEILRSLV